MILTNKNYNEFCDAFNQLVTLAKINEDVHDYVYDLHNKITNGATKRIFKDEQIPLDQLKVSQMNFERYVNQSNNELDLQTALSIA